jgi:hypothetical protein
MRALVCLESPEATHRVLWLSESKGGIYVGAFNQVVDTHSSYHQDGTRHFRVANSHHQRWKDVPLSDHSGVKQLLHSSIPLQEANTHQWPTHTSTVRDEILLITRDQFVGYNTMAVDVWLADCGSDAALTDLSQTAHLRHGYVAVLAKSWGLKSFSNLKLAISIWAAHVVSES